MPTYRFKVNSYETGKLVALGVGFKGKLKIEDPLMFTGDKLPEEISVEILEVVGRRDVKPAEVDEHDTLCSEPGCDHCREFRAESVKIQDGTPEPPGFVFRDQPEIDQAKVDKIKFTAGPPQGNPKGAPPSPPAPW